MDNVKRGGYGFAAVGLLLGLSAAAPGAAWGYVPTQEELLADLALGAPGASAAILDLKCTVFKSTSPAVAGTPVAGTPAASGTPAAGTPAAPVADPARSFRQRIYWQRGALLAVETLADAGATLDVQLDEGLAPQHVGLDPGRKFSEWDVRTAIFPFLEGRADVWRQELGLWGVRPQGVMLVLVGRDKQFYGLSESPGKTLWIDKSDGRPARLETVIDGAAPLALTLAYAEYTGLTEKGPEKQNPRIPRRFTYALGGRVVKEVYLEAWEINPPQRKFPLARLRQQVGAGQRPLALIEGGS
jgi:hypothetical protein